MSPNRRKKIQDLLRRGGMVRREPVDKYSVEDPTYRSKSLKLKPEEAYELLDEGSLIAIAPYGWWALRPDLVAARSARIYLDKNR